MKNSDFLIIGGSAAGTTAAETIRNNLPNSSITIVTDEDHEQYSRVLLPHYIRGKVAREQVFLKKEEWYVQKNIVLLKELKALSLEVSRKQVRLSNGEVYKYGKLLIAIGGKVIKLNVPGADSANILYLRTIEDADMVIEASRKSKRGLIIGGGFVSLDFATGFRVNGVREVTILTRDPYFWSAHLDPESSRIMTNLLSANGVEIMTGEEVDHFEAQKGDFFLSVGSIVTKSKKKLESDIVGVGIGIKSDLEWLIRAGIKTNRAIVTNEYLETNIVDVYAAGDCAEFHDVFFERQHIMGNWANATSQGNAVGRTMSGARTVFETASSYSDTFFNNSYSFIGVTDEKFADEAINRGSVEAGKMTRIFVKKMNGSTRIVGATVINSVADVSPLTTVVKNSIDIVRYKDNLGDEKFDLREVIA